MKRFYKTATADEHSVLLDGRPLRTPGKALLALPSAGLAQAIAEEWQCQSETLDPTSMPLTRLANTTIDGVALKRVEVIEQILRFAIHDQLCYRATYPTALVARQTAEWDPLLDWLTERYGVRLAIGSGIAHVEQPAAAMEALRRILESRDPFQLAGLHVASSITSSLVLGLALTDGRLDVQQAFALSQIDEAHQAVQWGLDSEAEARGKRLEAELVAADRFLKLL